MTSFVFFIERIAPGLYIMSVAGILYMAYELQRARRRLSSAQFKLERELALAHRSRAITFGGLLVEFFIGVWAITNLMAPTLRDIRLGGAGNTNTGPDRFITSTPASNPPVALNAGGTGEEGPQIFQTPPPTNTPVGTIIPDAPDVVGCPRDSAWIHIPGNGQLIFEATNVIGTANISDFALYKFEIKPDTPGAQFAPIGGDYTQPVIEGPLGQILPWELPNDTYRFRLAVFDNTRQLRAVCEVTIHISDPPPTITPIIAGTTPQAPQ